MPDGQMVLEYKFKNTINVGSKSHYVFWVFLNYGELRESGEFRRIPILRKIVISFRRILILRKIVISKLRRIPIIFFSQRILKLFVNFSLTHELPLSGECKHILSKIVIS